MENPALLIPLFALMIPVAAIISTAITKKYKYLGNQKGAEQVAQLEERIRKLEETIAGVTGDVERIEEKQQFFSRLLEDK